MIEVGLLAAFAAGVLALLSPCSALLLPSFFAYAFATKRALLRRTAAFYVGLLLTLVPLGTGAGAASALFYGHRSMLISIAGWFIIGLGVLQVLGRGFAVPFVGRLQARSQRAPGDGDSSWLSTVALGAVYGLAGFCSGPVLGAILTMAATQSTPWEGGLLLAVYALGMSAPLFVLAALWERFDPARRSWLRGRMLRLGALRVHSTSLISGALFVAIGVIFLRYDGTAGIAGSFGLGDTTELEFEAQQWVSEAAAGVPLWVPALLVAVVAAAIALRRSRMSERDDPEEQERTDQEAVNH